MTKPRILYIVTQADWGGAQKYVFELAIAAQDELEVSVAVGHSQDRTLVTRLNEYGITVHELNHLVRPLSPYHDLANAWEIAQVIRQIKPDIVHLNSSKAGITGTCGSVIARLFGTKHRLVYTVHGWAFRESINLVYRGVYAVSEWLLSWPRDLVIFIGAADERAARYFPLRQHVCIANGIDPDISFIERNIARQQLGVSADSFVVGTIANFYATKNLGQFIAIINQARTVIPNLAAVIIGDGDLRPQLEAQINDLSLVDVIKLPGKLPNASAHLKAFDAYLITSTKEGLPFSLLEAMSAELPIVTSNIEGLNDIITEATNGLLFDVTNTRAAVDALVNFYQKQDRARTLGQAARQTLIANYTQRSMIGQTLAAYRVLVAK
ncbi:MAG: glycosyltransferase [Candidatus Buchananbacteria bacterium]|nr:glycosyltransferase [Candidatus Buchananbacteria bacterium]